jgi:hypothetical protein
MARISELPQFGGTEAAHAAMFGEVFPQEERSAPCIVRNRTHRVLPFEDEGSQWHHHRFSLTGNGD